MQIVLVIESMRHVLRLDDVPVYRVIVYVPGLLNFNVMFDVPGVQVVGSETFSPVLPNNEPV